MSCYPKHKRRIAEGGLKFDTSALLNQKGTGLDSGVAGAIGTASTALFGPDVKTDERGFQQARSMGNYVGKSAVQGAAMGSQFGFVGAGIGAGIGAAVGFFNGKAIRKKADRSNELLTASYQNRLTSQGNAQYHQNLSNMGNALYRNGSSIYPAKTRLFSRGGVILGGENHENKGNLIVDDSGKTIAESEREELLLGVRETEMINRMIEMIDRDQSEMSFAQLGKFFTQSVFPTIKDNSGKFNLNRSPVSDDL